MGTITQIQMNILEMYVKQVFLHIKSFWNPFFLFKHHLLLRLLKVCMRHLKHRISKIRPLDQKQLLDILRFRQNFYQQFKSPTICYIYRIMTPIASTNDKSNSTSRRDDTSELPFTRGVQSQTKPKRVQFFQFSSIFGYFN